MKTVNITKGTTRVKKFVVEIENNPQRFSTKRQAIKFAEDNNFQVNDLTPKVERKIKVSRWQ